jgi:hypothetical protein
MDTETKLCTACNDDKSYARMVTMRNDMADTKIRISDDSENCL